MAKPKPVPRQLVCSECGLPWAEHTKGRKTEPTAEVCLRLLKAELAKPVRHPYAQASGTNPAQTYSQVVRLGGVSARDRLVS